MKQIKSLLFELGIIETDNHYVVGKKAIGYRFTPQYRGIKFKKIENPYFKQIVEPLPTNAPHLYLWQNLESLTIEPEAFQFIETEYGADTKKYNKNQVSATAISTRNWHLKVSPNTGRVFHNAVTLSKKLRRFLKLDGKPLCEIDVANCQPLLLHSFYEDKSTEEARRYLSLVESGKFYELLQTLTEIDDREKVKKQFLTFLFSMEEDLAKWMLPIEDAFARQFPTLIGIISKIRKANPDELWKRLQGLEADIIIGKITPKCEALGMKVLTIHDSFLAHEEDATTIKALIEEEFAVSLNTNVTVRMK